MYKIAIAIQKGGTAKTTTTLCLAGALTLLGYKVLVLDLDPQANSTRSLVIDRSTITTPTMNELLTDTSTNILDTIIQTGYGIDLIPANISLALAERNLMAAISAKKLHRKFVELEQLNQEQPEAGLNYDFVLMDCPPSLGVLTLNALAAADGIVSPLNCEYYAEDGLGDFLNTMREVQLEVNERVKILGVVLTMYNATKTHKDVATNLRQFLGDKVFETIITKRAVLTEVPIKGPVQAYAPGSESANEYHALALEVIEHAKQ